MTHVDVDWNATVRDLGPGLLRYFLAVFPRAVAADLVQEVLLRLVLKVRSGHFQTSKGSLRMYAYGIARLVRLEGRRSEGKVLHVVDADLVAATDDTADSDAKQELRTAVQKLKKAEQEIILLLLDRDLGLAEIGELLGIPLNTVKSHVHRAKESLKELLRDRSRVEER